MALALQVVVAVMVGMGVVVAVGMLALQVLAVLRSFSSTHKEYKYEICISNKQHCD
jgi:hypothetical protein